MKNWEKPGGDPSAVWRLFPRSHVSPLEHIGEKGKVHYLKLELVSGTYLMGQKQHIRVFQEEQKTYEKMYEVITKEYFQNGVVFGERAKSTVKDLVVQYKETDWEFANRLAASSGGFLIPEVLTMGTRY